MMNTEPSEREEAPERLKQIRANLVTAKAEKARYRYYEPPTWDDVELVLSLLDSQAADYALVEKYVAEVKHELGLPPNAHLSISLERYRERVATRMRERCVEKVRERAGAWREERYMNDLERRRFNAYAEEADNAANALESLTLDGEKEQ